MWKYLIGLILLAALFFIPGLGNVHLFDWDEVNFAEISREMIVTEELLQVYVNFQPFWEKPPYFFWLQSAAMRLFGVGEFAARLPNALCGMLTLALLYLMGRRVFDHRFGMLWAMAYFGSMLPHLYFKSGIIDPWFNLFIVSGLYVFLFFHWRKNEIEGVNIPHSKWTYLFWAGFLIGMGVLTKGPVAYLVIALCLGVYWLYERFRFYIQVHEFLAFTFFCTLTSLTWYGLETLKNGPWFIEQFNAYQYRLFSTPDAGHKGFPGYHAVVLLIGCFPISIFALRTFWKMPSPDTAQQRDLIRWMKILFWVVLVLFTIVQSKIVHYSSICYFPLAFLAAWFLYQWMDQKVSLNRWMRAGLWSIASLYALAVIAAPFIGQQIELIKPLFKDPFAKACMDAPVHWSGWEALPGLFLLLLMRAFSWLALRQKRWYASMVLFLGVGIFVQATLFFFIQRIEQYSQGPAVEFCESKAHEDCIIYPLHYKTYIPLFYGLKQPQSDDRYYEKQFLINGDIQKPVYFITKIHRTAYLDRNDQLERIGTKGGFVFYLRKPE